MMRAYKWLVKHILEPLGSLLFPLAFLLFLIYASIPFIQDSLKFLQTPNAMAGIIEWIKIAGMIAGVVVLLFAILFLTLLLTPSQTSSKVSRLSKEYPVLARLLTPGQELEQPVYLGVVMTNYGPSLGALQAPPQWNFDLSGNQDRFQHISGGRDGVTILPSGYYQLYYVLIEQVGSQVVELIPVTGDGYTGGFPVLCGQEKVELVLVFNGIYAVNDEGGQLRSLETPQKIKLEVLDSLGQYDLAATQELYEEVFAHLHPPEQEEEDYSWLYRSRPIYW